MKHLDESRLVDALDGALTSSAEAHLSTCRDCRSQLEQLRAALAAVRRADEEVPPSPLFWQHFTDRVNTAIDAGGTPTASGARRWLPHALAWCGAAALAIALHMVATSPGRPPEPVSPAGAATLSIDDDIEQDEAWAVIRDLAEDLDYDSAQEAGVAPRAGSLDRVALELTDAERAELARLIDEELKRIGP